MTTWQPLDPRLADSIRVTREYFGPEAEQWLDDEVVHRLMLKAIDLERQLVELCPKKPAWERLKWWYDRTRDIDAW